MVSSQGFYMFALVFMKVINVAIHSKPGHFQRAESLIIVPTKTTPYLQAKTGVEPEGGLRVPTTPLLQAL